LIAKLKISLHMFRNGFPLFFKMMIIEEVD